MSLSQEDLNKDMLDLGVSRYRSKVTASKDREAESETRYGQRLIRGGLPSFTKAIHEMVSKWDNRNSARWQQEMKNMSPAVVGFITIRAVLDSITLKKSMAAVSHFVGSRIEDQCRCAFLVKNNEAKGEGIILGAIKKRGNLDNTRRHLRASMKHEAEKGLMPEYDPWRRRDKLGCGLNLVELLRDVTGLVEYVYILHKHRKSPTRYVTASKETLRWIEEFNEDRELLEPFWLPSVETPVDWTNLWEGGYNLSGTALPQQPFIKTTNMDFLRVVTKLKSERLEKTPMKACNLIQNTPWRVNNAVLGVADWAWKNNVDIGSLPCKDDEPLPDLPRDFSENKESNRRWRQMAAGIYSRNASTRSKRMLTAKILLIAEKMSGSRFFYPSHCDFRGRVYNIPSFLGIMGNDLCRGLLTFARTERVKTDDQAKWLAVHGANTWGYDKVTLHQRWKWAEEFSQHAIKIAANPTKELLWAEADKPWSFLAWCLEWAKYKSTGKCDSSLPVNLDASNNGLQILSMLTRDPYGMTATNVLPTETPADIYNVVAERVTSYLQEDYRESGGTLAKTWLDFGINRKTTKRPVMCYSYGLTQYSNRAYINEWYEDEVHGKNRVAPFDADDKFTAINYLARLVWRGIEEVLQKPKKCMQWFQECARLIANENRPVEWVSPSGFPVYQQYFNILTQQVNTYISGKATCVKFNEDDTSKVSRRRMINGASPNVVHSLDAAALHMTVERCNEQAKIYDFAMIHDSYGTHALNCDALSKILREVFVDIFSRDQLRLWVSQLEEANPDITFPSPPEYGDAEITKIKESTYFFS